MPATEIYQRYFELEPINKRVPDAMLSLNQEMEKI